MSNSTSTAISGRKTSEQQHRHNDETRTHADPRFVVKCLLVCGRRSMVGVADLVHPKVVR